ncbi:hypothetical protein BVX95_02275 [archaeon D22]|nr:hypothetical protein BVX95_02275 [archaeon D22]
MVSRIEKIISFASDHFCAILVGSGLSFMETPGVLDIFTRINKNYPATKLESPVYRFMRGYAAGLHICGRMEEKEFNNLKDRLYALELYERRRVEF